MTQCDPPENGNGEGMSPPECAPERICLCYLPAELMIFIADMIGPWCCPNVRIRYDCHSEEAVRIHDTYPPLW